MDLKAIKTELEKLRCEEHGIGVKAAINDDKLSYTACCATFGGTCSKNLASIIKEYGRKSIEDGLRKVFKGAIK